VEDFFVRNLIPNIVASDDSSPRGGSRPRARSRSLRPFESASSIFYSTPSSFRRIDNFGGIGPSEHELVSQTPKAIPKR